MTWRFLGSSSLWCSQNYILCFTFPHCPEIMPHVRHNYGHVRQHGHHRRDREHRRNTPGLQVCSTFSCTFLAEVSRDYCCNGCRTRHPRTHSRNCAQTRAPDDSVHDQMLQDPIVALPTSSTSSTMGGPSFVSFAGVAHRLSEVDESDDCSIMDVDHSGDGDSAYQVPRNWVRDEQRLLAYLNWFAMQYNTPLTATAKSEWLQTETYFDLIRRQRDGDSHTFELTLHAYPSSCKPPGLPYIDVDIAIPCDARGVRDLDQKTGCDFAVMAELARQPSVAVALRLAALQIHSMPLDELAFICNGGTHRSFGCACLLAALCYPEAYAIVHTHRTRTAAKTRLTSVAA